jgi:hypothetical protein
MTKRPNLYELVDQANDGAVVSQHPTHLTAFNASKRLEPMPSLVRPDPFARGRTMKDWRYLIRRIRNQEA